MFLALDIQDFFSIKNYETFTDNSLIEIYVKNVHNKVAFEIKPEITEVALVQYNLVNNAFEYDIRSLHTHIPNKSFGEIIEGPTNKFAMLVIFN